MLNCEFWYIFMIKQMVWFWYGRQMNWLLMSAWKDAKRFGKNEFMRGWFYLCWSDHTTTLHCCIQDRYWSDRSYYECEIDVAVARNWIQSNHWFTIVIIFLFAQWICANVWIDDWIIRFYSNNLGYEVSQTEMKSFMKSSIGQ